MDKEKIVQILKEEMKRICRVCNAEVDDCWSCDIHILVNRIVTVLNGGS